MTEEGSELEEYLDLFRDSVRSFARFKGRIEKVNADRAAFRPEVADQVVREADIKAAEALSIVMHMLPKIEGHLAGARRERAALVQDQLRMVREADERELRATVGAPLSAAVEIDEASQQAVAAQLTNAEDKVAAIRKALDLWYDIGGDVAVTL